MSVHAIRDAWLVRAQDKSYGPFTRAQMTAFVAEGRIVSATLVTHADQIAWRAACDIAWLATALLDVARAKTSAPNGEPTAIRATRRAEVRAAELRAANGGANLFVWADVHSASLAGLRAALESLGPCAEVVPYVWIVRTPLAMSRARDLLAKAVGPNDRLLVVDASHDRLGWLNLGPDVEARVRGVWTYSPPTPANDVSAVGR